MRRYQFAPIHMHVLDFDKAAGAVIDNGGLRPRKCFPDMGDWLGTNQPETISFTSDEATAKKICEAYGSDLARVEEKNR